MAGCRWARSRRTAVAGLVVVVVAVVLTGCAAADSHQTDPSGQEPESRSELFEITPSPARPGETIELWFPEGTERGLGWALEEKDEQGWHVRYYLTSQPKQLRGHTGPSWRPVKGDGPG